ncbi:MAG: glycosyltransferase family 4 protein [Nitrospira sp. CG24E]|nr:MAG: glycosyltransferase family 4 protein [Nitrospira sp. CG24E]
MIVCHVWDADYPWDVRVEKVCDSLLKKHEVHLVCRNSRRRARYEYAEGLHIHRLPCLAERYGGLNGLIGFPAFFNPLWIYEIWKTIEHTKADVIVVRDLPLAWTALGIGRLLGLPVVLDMAENYPAMIQDLWDHQGFSIVNFLVRNPGIIRMVERVSVRRCDHVVAVVEESRTRLISLGVDPARISLVINTPTSGRLVSSSRVSGVGVPRGPRSFTLLYLGLLEWARGIETAIRAIPLVRKRLPEVRLVIVGSGRHEADFKQIAAQLELQDSVQFLGWLDYTKAIEVIKECDIGLVPHHATESWNTTIPNKLFDYMSMGKPVIVSDAKPTKRIVQEERCGMVFEDQNAEDLSRVILKLEDESVREEMGRNGREAVATKYNWTVDEERLLKALDLAMAGRKR